MAREVARELARLQAASPGGEPTPPAYRPMTADLITGGPAQCVHGVAHGAWLRPDLGTPACPMCRLIYLDALDAPPRGGDTAPPRF